MDFFHFYEVMFWDFLAPYIKYLVIDVILASKTIGAITIVLSVVLAYLLYIAYQAYWEATSYYRESRLRLYEAIASAHEERKMEVNNLREKIKNLIDEMTKRFQPDDVLDGMQEDLKALSIGIVNPKTATDYYLKGYSCLVDDTLENRYEKAIVHFNGAIRRAAAHHGAEIADQEINYELAGAYYGLGLANQMLAKEKKNAKNYRSAIKYYGKATKREPEHKIAYLNMGYSLEELERNQEDSK